MDEMTYENAEAMPHAHLRLAQWARAEALKALMASGRIPTPAETVAWVNAYAELIIEGGMSAATAESLPQS